MTRDTDLPKYIYKRGSRLWCTYRDETGKWVKKPTPYGVEDAALAGRYVARIVKRIADQLGQDVPSSEMTVEQYSVPWLKEREERGIICVDADRSRLAHALPYVGSLRLDEVTPRHVRDMLRGLKREGAIAPRTQLHVVMTLHGLFKSALIEGHVTSNPVVVAREEMPKKTDADREWRSQATYTVREVQRLICEPLIPPERRVLYALKAMLGLRHGEAVALCWRHIDHTAEPLARVNVVQAWSTTLKAIKGTKMEEQREIPLHPELARLLKVWREEHWPRIYGRAPTDDDLVAPTRTMSCVAAKDANEAMRRDLLMVLKVRVKAGKRRHRGGHDLRAWFETRLIEDDADSEITKRFTHAPPKTVAGGYQRFSWDARCRELAKLSLILDGEPLRLGTGSVQAEKKAGRRWTSVVTPMRLEASSKSSSVVERRMVTDGDPRSNVASGRSKTTDTVPRVYRARYAHTAARMLERAAQAGDLPKVLEIAAQLREARDGEDD